MSELSEEALKNIQEIAKLYEEKHKLTELDLIQQVVNECLSVASACGINGRDKICAFKNYRMAKWLQELLTYKKMLEQENTKECIQNLTEE